MMRRPARADDAQPAHGLARREAVVLHHVERDERAGPELDRLAIMFFEKCKEVFPYVNGVGNSIMGTDKVHFMLHAASEIMKWGSIINCSAEVVETNHKTWVKEQGQNTNQGASSAKIMMKN